MEDIKELTRKEHAAAEEKEFVSIIMSGSINPELFAIYLHNQYECYDILEKYAEKHHLFDDTPGLQRAENLKEDVNALWTDPERSPPTMKSTEEYKKHIEKIKDDPALLYTHVYVRHMGDMRGGQMIKKKTPGPNKYYEFTKQDIVKYSPIIKDRINSYCTESTDKVLDEARLCYDYASRLFEELDEVYRKYYKEKDVGASLS